MRIAFLLLLSFTAQAQLPIVPLQRFVASGIAADMTGVAFRWVASDLATNTAISGNWTDRVQSVSWLQGASTRQPTNANDSGVVSIWMDSSHWLTNGGITLVTSNIAIGMIMKLVDPFTGVHPDFLSAGNEGVCNSTASQLGLQDTTFNLRYTPGCDTFNYTANKFGSNTNHYMDLIFSQVTTNNNTGGFYFYTNNVLGANNNASISANQYFGNSASAANYPVFLGRNNFRSSGPSWRLAELWIWTNSAPGAAQGNNLSVSSRTNFHRYATNAYAFSP